MKVAPSRYLDEQGFSLTELMIAIVVTAILIALIVPMGRKAIESSRMVECTRKLRQLGARCLETALENNGSLAWYEAPKGRSGMWWYKIYASEAFVDFNRQMTCPSGKGRYTFAYSLQGKTFHGNYRYNKRLGYQASNGGWVYPLVRYTAVSAPSRIALIADNARRSDDTMGWEGTWAQILEAHQDQTAGFVFCLDGHIERIGPEYMISSAPKKVLLNPADLNGLLPKSRELLP